MTSGVDVGRGDVGRGNGGRTNGRARRHGGARWWYLLLVLPFVGLLWVPLYAKKDPEVFGFPFFYWYQFVWVVVAAALTILVYLATKADR